MNLDGILPPIATPFGDDEIDYKALRSNVDRWMRTGLRGLVALGSNGEAPFIDASEAERVIETVREGVPSDRVLIAGTGRPSTRETIAACRAAARAGADAVLVLTPSYYKTQMTGDVFLRHYRAVADASPVPVLIYNFPGVTGVSMPLATVQALAEHSNIKGIKESSGDVALAADLVSTTPSAFRVVVGSAATLYASLAVGVDGGVIAVANVVPELCVELHGLVRSGRHNEALAMQRALTPLARAVTTTYGVAGLKAAMDAAGYIGGKPRQPLAPASIEARQAVTTLLETLMARR